MSHGQQGDQTNQSYRKSVLNIHWKDWCWNSNPLATWCEELSHWKSPWWWERLKAGRDGEDRGWDGWIASLTHWTWIWAISKCLQWTGKPGVLQSIGSQRVELNWATELNWYVTWSNFLSYQSLFPYLQNKDHIPNFDLLAFILSNKY